MNAKIIITILSILVMLCCPLHSDAKKKSKKAMDEVTTARYIAIENGLQSILRAEIIRQHEKHTERHYCPLYAKEAMVKVYDAYHALGGNGMMTRFYHEIIALPEEPQQKED